MTKPQEQIEALRLGQAACLVALALEPISTNHDKWKKAYDIIGEQIAAAAKVENGNEHSVRDLDNSMGGVLGVGDSQKELVAATIKRCAQVAKAKAKALGWAPWTGEVIEDAIRALKIGDEITNQLQDHDDKQAD